MKSLLTTEMVQRAVEDEYGSMFVNAKEEFEAWLRSYVEHEVAVRDEWEENL